MEMKEQFRTNICRTDNIKLLGTVVLALAILIALFTFLNADAGSGKTDRMQLSVGEDAWGEVAEVNISESITPSTLELEKSELLVWRNRNDFEIRIRIKGVKKDFKIPSNGKKTFKPSSEFEYDVKGEGEILDSGKVFVQ